MTGAIQDPEEVKGFIEDLNQRFAAYASEDVIDLAIEWFSGAISFANSFGAEDLVIQHRLLGKQDQIESFVLDTGRLPSETYDLIERWRLRYDIPFRILSPKTELLEPFVSQHGPNPFYESVALRKRCCAIRKLEPLERALSGKQAWITGLRREQSQARSGLDVFDIDAQGRIKISPLANWSVEQVWAYIHAHSLPYNVLHDRGYPSIGCAPCTRAIEAGEDIRAGRWWWEIDNQRECGLHSAKREETAHAR